MSLRVIACMVLLAAAAVQAGEQRQQHREDSPLKAEFARSVTDIRLRHQDEQQLWRRPASGWVDHWIFRERVARLAEIAAEEEGAVEFLADQARMGGPPLWVERRLALLTLGTLGSQRAAQILFERLVPSPNELNRGMLVAMSYLPPEQARRLLESWIEKLPGPKPGAEDWEGWSYGNIAPVGHLAAVLGDADTLEKLKALEQRLQRQPDVYGSVTRQLNHPIQTLEARVGLPEEQRVRRMQNELLFWQAVNEGGTAFRNQEIEYSIIPERLARRGLKIDADFLLERIANCPPETPGPRTTRQSCLRMAMAILAEQEPPLAVRHLGPLTAEPHPEAVRTTARRVLETMTAPEAVRFFEQRLAPDAGAASNRHIAHWLIYQGDHDSVELLERLAEDERFSAEDREQFRRAAKSLRELLKARPT